MPARRPGRWSVVGIRGSGRNRPTNRQRPTMTLERKTVALPQGTLRYHESGAGEPLVFVHGLVTNADHWRHVIPDLRDAYRCLAPDLPLGAHTRPLAADADLAPADIADLLVAFLNALDLESATFVGNDTGGAFCQVLVATRSEAVDRLVLAPCDAFDRFLPMPYRPIQWGARSQWATFLGVQSLRFGVVRRLAFAPVTRTGIPPGLMREYVAPLVEDAGVRRDLRTVLCGISSGYTNLAARSFPDYERPVLVVWGHDDPVFPIEDGRRLAELFPDSQLVEISGTGAFIPEDRPGALVDEMQRFLAETERV